MLYIRLFHGRADPNQNMDDWGSDGPVFGPYKFVHTTYLHHVMLGKTDSDCDELFTFEDMLYYGGVYYGDWSVFDESTCRDGNYSPAPFDKSKAHLPSSQ